MNHLENLVGQTLGGRWLVEECLRNANSNTTGGFFSVPFRASEVGSGKEAFLKVVDLIKAMRETYHDVTVTEALQRLLDNHSFEVFLSQICTERKMKRVVHAIDSGEHPLETAIGRLVFPYIVFELADGDVHNLLTIATPVETVWKVGVLHQVATAVQQLHHENIAHQDIKRSNVVFFGADNAKLTDLGRAVKSDRPSRNDNRDIPCQLQNAPPELLYHFRMEDWGQRHFATDLYMLGNLMCTIFTNITVTSFLLQRLAPDQRPFSYTGAYDDVLPALHRALGELLTALEGTIPKAIRADYLSSLALLCNPDPRKRGHPRDHSMRHGRRYSAERFISYFSAMYRKARFAIR